MTSIWPGIRCASQMAAWKACKSLKEGKRKMGYWSESALPFFFFLSCISARFIHLSLEHEEKYIYFVTGASLPTTVPHKNNNVTYISKYNF